MKPVMALWLALLPALLLAQPARIERVSDGDTVRVQVGRQKSYSLRLSYIDAPELKQSYGKASRDHLLKLIDDRPVEVEVFGQDRYGRKLGRILIDGVDLSYLMVRDGYAWHYRQYAKKDQDGIDYAQFEVAEVEARRAWRGLWRDRAPQAPWQWRREN
ncbi:thermonuclease family protein [Chitinibacteraceae bacterium HSL-7]